MVIGLVRMASISMKKNKLEGPKASQKLTQTQPIDAVKAVMSLINPTRYHAPAN